MSRLPAPSSSALPTLGGSKVTTRSRTAMTNSTNITKNAKSGSSTNGANNTSTKSLKRKNSDRDDDDDAEELDQPRKLPAIIGGPSRPGMSGPLRPTRAASNLPHSRGGGPAANKPSGVAPRTRSTSAPAKGLAASGMARGGARGRGRGAPPGRGVSGGPIRPGIGSKMSVNNEEFLALQEKVSSIEAARAEDAARVAAEMEAERQKVSELQTNHMTLSQELAESRSQEITQRRELMNASGQIEDLKRKHVHEIEELEDAARKRERELRDVKEDLRYAKEDLDREKETTSTLKTTISQQATAQIALNAQNSALEAELSSLRSLLDCKQQDATELRFDLENARKRISELEGEIRDAEMTRRRLHNTIQELKGNIRVFCRVRPVLPSELYNDLGDTSSGLESLDLDELEKAKEACMARIEYPDQRDHREIVLSSSSESVTGQERKETWNFSFDRVFGPASTQVDIFEEISQLAQSCTDGYNVCIFAYGQTGSGKSFTMEGGSDEETAGMIPRAVEQVFRVAEELKHKGWEYRMEGQFLEIYNETINDLLGKGEIDKKKHEIKHDKGTTKVTDVVVVPLKTASQVRSLLSIAQSRRTVASTLMNERSSRSHSVFTLRIFGSNSHSGERCEGSLNLVDLAGSERLNSSGAGNDKDRLKETQNINKSLSALADVIAALGEKGEKADKHIPYRNSKLTYLLQNSLSGASKTLMVLNLSPLAAHLGESLCSLRFATKVNNTTLGTAKKQTKVGP